MLQASPSDLVLFSALFGLHYTIGIFRCMAKKCHAAENDAYKNAQRGLHMQEFTCSHTNEDVAKKFQPISAWTQAQAAQVIKIPQLAVKQQTHQN